MVADLRDRLVRVAPRERAGARAASRLEYQRHWALVELLARHERGEDYCVVFEHHDDVVFLDNADAPTGIEFFQIKTNDRDWTLNALIARSASGDDTGADGRTSAPADTGARRRRRGTPSGQSTGLSIIGKLYENWLKYESATRALTFVSNHAISQSCRLRPNTDRQRFCATALAPEEWQRLVGAILAEHGASVRPDGLRLLHLVRTQIPAHEGQARVHSLGALTDFLAKLAPGQRLHAAAVHALHGAVMSELARLNTYEGTHRDYEDLLAHQGLSRRQFGEMLVRAGLADDLDAAWQEIHAQLLTEGWSFLKRRRLHEAWTDYLLARMDSTNVLIQRQRRRVRAAIARERAGGFDGPLRDLITAVRTACASGPDAIPSPGQSEEDVAAMILMELMTREPVDDAVQAARPRPPQEAA